MDAAGMLGRLSANVKPENSRRWSKKTRTGTELQSTPLGLVTIFEPSQPVVDIVFVHGLQGHVTKTWTVSNVCWPRDLLPKDLPKARILSFGYSGLAKNGPPILIKDLGKTLLECLTVDRRHGQAATRPLIFVAHSLGGLLVKIAIMYSRALSSVDKDSYHFSKAIIACIFFGTPQVRQSSSSWQQICSQICRSLAAQSPLTTQDFTSLVDSLAAEEMVSLSSVFLQQSHQMQLVSCYETRPTATHRGKLLVVPRESALLRVPGEVAIALDADHTTMTKFTSSASSSYQQIVQAIAEATHLEPRLAYHSTLPGIGDDRLTGLRVVHRGAEEGGTDLIEQERRFLTNLRSDWLDEVTIVTNTPGTCEWVLDSQQFQTWLSKREPILWVIGKPGSGKTVFAKFVYRQLFETTSNSSDSLSAHRPQWASHTREASVRSRQILVYFFQHHHATRNSGLSVLQSLLYQILSTKRDLFKFVHANSIFPRPQQGGFVQYMDILNAVLQDSSMLGTIIILDALDECEEESRQPIYKFFSTLAEGSNIQLLVTSRPINYPRTHPVLDLSQSAEHVNIDVKRYVQAALKQYAEVGRFPEDLEDSIVSNILQRSSGGFLWAQLMLPSLCKAKTVRMLRATLDLMPRDLLDVYSSLLCQISGFTGVNLRRALYFVMVAKVPLRIRELSAFLAISQCWDSPFITPEPPSADRSQAISVPMLFSMKEIIENQTMDFEQEFESNLGPLLTKKEGSILLVHLTLRDYLIYVAHADLQVAFNFPQQRLRPLMSLSDVHTLMAIMCLQYMLESFDKDDDPLGFVDFACLYWTEHARESSENLKPLLEEMVRLLFSAKTGFAPYWLRSVSIATESHLPLFPKNVDVAFVLAAFNLGHIFGATFTISVGALKTTDDGQQTPLHLAAANNALSTVKWMQEVHDAACQSFGDLASLKDSHGQSPISLAAQYGHDEMTRILLTSAGSKHIFELSLFQNIAATGNKDMFELLYGHTEFQSPEQGLSLLTSAVRLKSLDLLKRIYDEHVMQGNGSSLSAAVRGVDGDHLLHAAILSGADDVFSFLRGRGCPLEFCVENGGNTPLHVAVQEGSQEIAEMLIAAGAAIDALNERGETPLHIASSIGLPAMVRLLCHSGADVNVAGFSGCLPAHLAAKTGHKGIIRVLLDRGTYVNATDNDSRSVIHTAAAAGHEATVALLLEYGADLNAQDVHGRTPVHDAVQSGDLSIVYMLCGSGADPLALDLENISPLHIAAEQGSDIIVRELICLGANVLTRDLKGRTPLHYCSSSKQPSVGAVRMLLEAGADADALDNDMVSALHLACEQGSDTIVRELVRRGADSQLRDLKGRTPLHYCCVSKQSSVAVARTLLEAGADVNQLDFESASALHLAAEQGHNALYSEMIEFNST